MGISLCKLFIDFLSKNFFVSFGNPAKPCFFTISFLEKYFKKTFFNNIFVFINFSFFKSILCLRGKFKVKISFSKN